MQQELSPPEQTLTVRSVPTGLQTHRGLSTGLGVGIGHRHGVLRGFELISLLLFPFFCQKWGWGWGGNRPVLV